jgi:Ca2+-binding RTX toxin-like protein
MLKKNMNWQLVAATVLASSIHAVFAQDVSSGDYVGTAGSDEFVVIGKTVPEGTSIDGLVGNKDDLGRTASGVYDPNKTYTLAQTLTLATDATVNLGFQQTGPGIFSTSAISTATTTRGTPNYVDRIVFTKSGDFTNLLFTNIEELHLNNGVQARISSEAFEEDATSLDLGLMNPGLHFFGTPGGRPERLTIVAEADETPITAPSGQQYYQADVQLDDSSTADLAHDGVELYFDFADAFELAEFYPLVRSGEAGLYARMDGSNNNDHVTGSVGIDNVTVRSGNDTVFAGDSNDYLVGGAGVDYLKGERGDDLFIISGFSGLIGNGEGKASLGEKQWVDGDRVNGGPGFDIFRITAGATNPVDGTIVLTDRNFALMDAVEIATEATRLKSEDGATQLINGHKYARFGTTVAGGSGVKQGESLNNVIVDASAIKAKGLIFRGNGNANTFIGTRKNDTFVSNGGVDILSGGLGKNVYQYGYVHEFTANDKTNVYDDVATALASKDADIITDFKSKKDQIKLESALFNGLGGVGKISDSLLSQGAGGGTVTTDTRLIFDTNTSQLSYDPDGSGPQKAVLIATLQGVPLLLPSDIVIY